MYLDLGVPGTEALAGIVANPDVWARLSARMHRGVFLRSEGMRVRVGPPQLVSGPLVGNCVEVIAAFNQFYADVGQAYYDRPDLRSEFLANPLFEPLFEIEAAHRVATPLSRYDAVLEPDGGVRVIELNPVGICLAHMRNLLYLILWMDRFGLDEDARLLDTLVQSMIRDGFVRFAQSRLEAPPKRLTIGALTLPNWMRAANLLFKSAFARAGIDYVYGGPDHLSVTDAGVALRGRQVDILWSDFFLYLAYQQDRYKETRFPSSMPAFDSTPAQAAALLADDQFVEHLRTGRVVNMSPARSYLVMSKSLLSWIHRSDRPVSERHRAFLAEHVARTYSHADRADGVISRAHVLANRGEFVLKPCQYGASHGVMLGATVTAEAWRERILEMWDDPTWVVQDYRAPARTPNGAYVSLGLPNFDGKAGGIIFRTSETPIINARDADFIAGVCSDRQ